MSLPVSVWAHVDQLVEEARARIPAQTLEQPAVQDMLGRVVEFLSEPTESLEAMVRLLAFAEFVKSVQGDPPCSRPSSPESQP